MERISISSTFLPWGFCDEKGVFTGYMICCPVLYILVKGEEIESLWTDKPVLYCTLQYTNKFVLFCTFFSKAKMLSTVSIDLCVNLFCLTCSECMRKLVERLQKECGKV